MHQHLTVRYHQGSWCSQQHSGRSSEDLLYHFTGLDYEWELAQRHEHCRICAGNNWYYLVSGTTLAQICIWSGADTFVPGIHISLTSSRNEDML
jgi:hypothetical protein